MFMCDVEEITDWRGEELTDKEIIQWKKLNCLKKPKLRELKNYKSSWNCSQRMLHYSRYLAAWTV